MNLKILSLNNFLKEVKKLHKRYKSISKDLKLLKEELKNNPRSGTKLGNNCYKIRLANSSVPTGKSGGFRVIYYYIDENNNIFIGDTFHVATKNSYIRAEHKLVTTLGVEDLIVVDTDDALLVANKSHVQDIKEIVGALTHENRDEVVLHKRVCRPWGCYQGIDHSDRFQVKRITVKPGAVLSLQLHHHRAEHWIVVNGTAKVTKGEDVFILSENESTYIPLGTKHRLENIGKIPLELIEVQTGSYLGEDDIVRFDDVYGREGK